jgi:hypothetical protein
MCQDWNEEKKNRARGVLLAISQEFGESVGWLLTGKEHVEPGKRVPRDCGQDLDVTALIKSAYAGVQPPARARRVIRTTKRPLNTPRGLRDCDQLLCSDACRGDLAGDVGQDISVHIKLINRKGSSVTVSATVGVPSLYRSCMFRLHGSRSRFERREFGGPGSSADR